LSRLLLKLRLNKIADLISSESRGGERAMTRNDDHPEPERKTDERADKRPRVIDAADLFQGSREVWLKLTGVRYRLRITRRNKLILQK
jgi:hemin uptake protein HemP